MREGYSKVALQRDDIQPRYALEVSLVVRQHSQTVIKRRATDQQIQIADAHTRHLKSPALSAKQPADFAVEIEDFASRQETEEIQFLCLRIRRSVDTVVHFAKRDDADRHALSS